MGLKSLFTKGVALAQSGKCRNHSQKASRYARQAMSYFRSAKSKKGDQNQNGSVENPDKIISFKSL